jgi:hypothetical protein
MDDATIEVRRSQIVMGARTFGDRWSPDGLRSSFRKLGLWVAEVGRFSLLRGFLLKQRLRQRQRVSGCAKVNVVVHKVLNSC